MLMFDHRLGTSIAQTFIVDFSNAPRPWELRASLIAGLWKRIQICLQ